MAGQAKFRQSLYRKAFDGYVESGGFADPYLIAIFARSSLISPSTYAVISVSLGIVVS